MIKSDHGNILIKGDRHIIYADLCVILDELLREEVFTDEELEKILKDVVKDKDKTDEELKEDLEKELEKFIKNMLNK